jgi:hypothetical protein
MHGICKLGKREKKFLLAADPLHTWKTPESLLDSIRVNKKYDETTCLA